MGTYGNQRTTDLDQGSKTRPTSPPVLHPCSQLFLRVTPTKDLDIFVSIGTMQQGFVGDWAIVPPMKEEKKEKEKEKRNKEF